MMPYWCWSGVMLQSDQFCRLTRTSVRRRATCASYLDGMPYIAGGIGRPISCAVGGTGSGAVRPVDATPPAASAPPARAALLRRNARRSSDSSLTSSSLVSRVRFGRERSRVSLAMDPPSVCGAGPLVRGSSPRHRDEQCINRAFAGDRSNSLSLLIVRLRHSKAPRCECFVRKRGAPVETAPDPQRLSGGFCPAARRL